MPFSHLHGDREFSPPLLEVMRDAYEDVCGQLRLTPGDPPTKQVAAKIFALARKGERDRRQLIWETLTSFDPKATLKE